MSWPPGLPRNTVRPNAGIRLLIAAMREVEAFTLASVDPFGYGYPRSLAIDGRPADVDAAAPGVTYVTVGADYFRTSACGSAAGVPSRGSTGPRDTRTPS